MIAWLADDGSCIQALLGCQNSLQVIMILQQMLLIFSWRGDNNIGSGSYFTGNQHLLFDAYKECIIKSAIVYAQSSNTITFQARDNLGAIIDDTTLVVVQGKQINTT